MGDELDALNRTAAALEHRRRSVAAAVRLILDELEANDRRQTP